MPFYYEGNVYIRRSETGEKVIFENPAAINESVEYINEHSIKHVGVSDFDSPDVYFLNECPGIEHLDVFNSFIKDLSGIYSLRDLRILSINETTTKNVFKIGELKNLQEVYGQLPSKTAGLNELSKLTRAQLWSYKPKARNLTEFSGLKSLKELILTQSNIITLEGIQEIVSLQMLQLNYLRSLKDVSALRKVKAPLIDVEFESCKGVEDFSSIGELMHLEQLKLINCGDIPSIRFTENLPKLKAVIFPDTHVQDGDLSVCENIEEVYYTKQKIKNRDPEKDMKLRDLALPTKEWETRMADGDDLFTKENIRAANKVLDSFMKNLTQDSGLTEKEIKKYVKQVTLKLNKLNEKYDYFIETLEREELCEYIMEAAGIAGLEFDGDITEEWREW
ncbi:hypothetical protein QNH42_24140 [Cytobacillus firmus]|nr:hypothetical protein [Cytobacillus firmus]WHY61621.1 hypothetical protein QNH42_24140 [Cytobacillus firmus]